MARKSCAPCANHRALCRHASACLGALAAGLCALLAVFVLMLTALPGAGLAYFSAYLAKLARMLAFEGHKLRGQAANRRALHIKTNTATHHVDIGLLQAGRSAVVAGFSALVTGVDTGFQIVLHASLLLLLRDC